MHNLQLCDGRLYEDLPDSVIGVTSLNALRERETSSVR